MKINHIIKEKRIERGYTQEQLASILGVTAPAVNKWEKGSSFPDITLLPVLARVLKTDLNTLLSFKNDLTREELAMFLNELSKIAIYESTEKAFETAKEKISEYPESDELILYCAIIIENSALMEKGSNIQSNYDEAEVFSWYEKACQSGDVNIKSMAQSSVVNKFIEKGEYEKAEKIIDEIPDKLPVDKKQLKINLALKKGEYEKAALLLEEKLLLSVTEILSDMTALMQITVKIGDLEDAKYISDVSVKAAELFDMQKYNIYIPKFLYLCSVGEKSDELTEVLSKLMDSTEEKWKGNKSPLYRFVKTKDDKDLEKILKRTLFYEIETNDSIKFLRETEIYKKLKAEISFPQAFSQSRCDKS